MEARRWRNGILAIVGTLLALGIVMIASTSSLKAGGSGDSSLFLRRQMVWAVIALGGMALAWQTDYHLLGRYRRWILFGILALLIAVLIPGVGHRTNGANRWIRFGGMGFQPSELAKLALLIFVASAVALTGARRSTSRGVFAALVGTGATVGLILVEPDFGTAVLVGTLAMGILFVAGIRLAHIIPIVAIGGTGVLYMMVTHFQHVRDRLEIFLNPGMDPLGKGYQVRQSLMALGSGGLWGRGLGESKQKLFFLPLEHSDFIFAVVGEELGLLGTLLVLGLFVGFIYCGLKIMSSAPDLLGYLLAFGIVLLVGLQAGLNIAVVTAALPNKGLPLPFISFGGSSLVISMVAVGILLNVASQGNWSPPRPIQAPSTRKGVA